MSLKPQLPRAMVDIHKLPEDDRIKLMGELVMTGETIWVLTDDEPGKIERYMQKIKHWFPAIKCGEIVRGFPGKGVGGFKALPPDHDRN